uniref:Uncharacterized protein n=1 Tax=Glypta fumiferanae TaxID=389681 RepID=A0A0F6Q750_9HYME|nr:hypothetical protein [Glypta fumiferanae]
MILDIIIYTSTQRVRDSNKQIVGELTDFFFSFFSSHSQHFPIPSTSTSFKNHQLHVKAHLSSKTYAEKTISKIASTRAHCGGKDAKSENNNDHTISIQSAELA